MTIPQIFDTKNFLGPDNLPPFASVQEWAIKMAQSIFEAWLKENSKVVYGYKDHEANVYRWDEHTNPKCDTHQALLVLIEPIKQEQKYCSECGKEK